MRTSTTSSPNAMSSAQPSSRATSTSPSGGAPSPTASSAPPPSTGSAMVPIGSSSMATVIALQNHFPNHQKYGLRKEVKCTKTEASPRPQIDRFQVAPLPDHGGLIRAISDRDFNPPRICAARHTLWAAPTPGRGRLSGYGFPEGVIITGSHTRPPRFRE